MGKVPKIELKNLFSTGNKPKQGDFGNWLDSYVHKDESINIASVNNLEHELANKLSAGEESNLIKVFNDKVEEAKNIVNMAYLGIADVNSTAPKYGAFWFRVTDGYIATFTNLKDKYGNPISTVGTDFKNNGDYFDVTIEVLDGAATKKLTQKQKPVNVVDNLNTESDIDALSAGQGVVLHTNINSVKAGGLTEKSIALDKLSQPVIDYIGSGGNISNNPDDEDLTSQNIGGLNVIKLKDRPFSPSNFGGLGQKILRKNMVNQKNVLTLDMLQAYSIIEIRYDFDLDGQTINLPDHVTLKFVGGSLSNGTLNGNGTIIVAALSKIFSSDILFTGSFACDNVFPEWFGAKSIMLSPIDNDAVTPVAANPPNEIDSLSDSANAINSALNFSLLSKGKVSLQAGCYRINSTIELKDRMHLEFSDKTIVFAYMQGAGNLITTQDPETSEFSDQDLDAPVITLLPNQYIRTEAMKVAINVSSVAARMSGRGTLSLVKSKYTIAVYMKGTGYRILDMATNTFGDLITVGGTNLYAWTPDTRDLSGSGIPDNSIGQIDQYYNDYTNNKYYRKNGNNIWAEVGSSFCEYNVSYRFEVYEGWGSGRIINPQFYFGDMLGWRGVEICTRGGGWFNHSTFKGAIANKTGSYVSIFTNYDVAEHDWSGLVFQIDARHGNDQRIFQAIRCGGIKTGITWDLNYTGPSRAEVVYYLGKFSRLNHISIDGYKYLIDRGENNSYDINPDSSDVNLVAATQYRNVLEYMTPANASINGGQNLYYIALDSIMNIQQIKDKVSNISTGGTGYTIPKEWFDEQRNSSTVVIDTDNGKFGCAFSLQVRQDQYAGFHGINSRGFVVIEYSVSGTNNINKDVGFKLHAIGIDRTQYGKGVDRTYNLSQKGASQNRNTLYIPITGKDEAGGGQFFIYPETNQSGKTLQVYSVKFIVDSDTQVNSWINNPRHGRVRPDAAPKGFLFYNEIADVAELNIGTSSVPIWQEFMKELAGAWIIPPNNALTSATASYSKLGKQVALSGSMDFSAADTNCGITLPYAPEYGGVVVVGELTFIMYSNSTSAYVKSATIGLNKTFSLNIKIQ